MICHDATRISSIAICMSFILLLQSAASDAGSPRRRASEEDSPRKSSPPLTARQDGEVKRSQDVMTHHPFPKRPTSSSKAMKPTDTAMRPSQSQSQEPKPTIDLSPVMQYREYCWHAKHSKSKWEPTDHTPRPFLLGSLPASACRGDIFLFIFVQSAVRNRAKRELIRSTWGAVKNIDGDRILTVFSVGLSSTEETAKELQQEMNTRADMVQGDFEDTYRNLTYKHLYSLKWIAESCPSVQFVMKADDDVVIDLFFLRETLREGVTAAERAFILCDTASFTTPVRKRSGPGSKWSVTLEEWPESNYPPYCLGLGYVLPGALAAPLFHCASWRRYFWIDDVFVSGMLAEALGVLHFEWPWGSHGWVDTHPGLAGPEMMGLVMALAEDKRRGEILHRRIWRNIVLRSLA